MCRYSNIDIVWKIYTPGIYELKYVLKDMPVDDNSSGTSIDMILKQNCVWCFIMYIFHFVCDGF